ncbi:uncharacterized protein TNCV_2815981 [Trichonephila clavipes]|nr:uncharacterized protein TNCV_2815981 [Trichonephila clavipes]
MEKLEWREAFHRQPAYYLFLDFTTPMSIHNLNTICKVLQDITALSVSLKECMQNTTTLLTGKETFETDQLTQSLQDAIQQYETYYQGAIQHKEEWPQLQVIFSQLNQRKNL